MKNKIVVLLFFILFIFLSFSIKLPLLHAYYKTPFIMPLDGNIVVRFRQTYWDSQKEVHRKHTGIDIEGKAGQKVLASGNGIVSHIGFSPIGGRTVVIRHNAKIKTTYLNLLNIYVSVGSYVSQGDIIASIGAIDDPSSEEYHLHFGIVYDGKYLDPEDVFKIDYQSISRFINLEYLDSDFKLNFNDY